MEETLHRAVRIHVLVGVGMVLDMGGGPVQGGPLKGHRAADQEEGADPVGCLEALVGEHPVVADRDAERAENVTDHQEHQVDGGDETTPETENGEDGAEKGDPDEQLEDDLGG